MKIKRGAKIIIFLLTLTFLWQFFSILMKSIYFPPVQQISTALVKAILYESLLLNLIITGSRIIFGLFISLLLGIALGILIASVPIFERILDFPLNVLRSLPPPVFIPLGIIIFGWGTVSILIIITLGSCWPIIINTIDGIKDMDKQWLFVAKQFGYNRMNIISDVVIPAILPSVFTGIRVSLSMVLIMVIISEMLMTTDGLGHLIVFAQRSFDVSNMYIGILAIGVLGFVFSQCLRFIENMIVGWHRLYEDHRQQRTIT